MGYYQLQGNYALKDNVEDDFYNWWPWRDLDCGIPVQSLSQDPAFPPFWNCFCRLWSSTWRRLTETSFRAEVLFTSTNNSLIDCINKTFYLQEYIHLYSHSAPASLTGNTFTVIHCTTMASNSSGPSPHGDSEDKPVVHPPPPPSLPIHRWLRTPTFCQTLRLLLTIWLMPSVLSSRSMRTLVVSLPCHPTTAPVATAARLQSCNAGIPPALRLRVPWTFGTTLRSCSPRPPCRGGRTPRICMSWCLV